MYFSDRGCVRTLRTLYHCMSTPLKNASLDLYSMSECTIDQELAYAAAKVRDKRFVFSHQVAALSWVK